MQGGAGMAGVAGEELGAGFTHQRQERAAQHGEGLRGAGHTLARTVFAPLGIALPVVFVFDSPVPPDDAGQPRGAATRGLQAGDKEALAFARRRRLAELGALHPALHADDGAREGQPDGLGLDGGHAHFVAGQPAVAFFVGAKRGRSPASMARAWAAAVGWLSLSEMT